MYCIFGFHLTVSATLIRYPLSSPRISLTVLFLSFAYCIQFRWLRTLLHNPPYIFRNLAAFAVIALHQNAFVLSCLLLKGAYALRITRKDSIIILHLSPSHSVSRVPGNLR